jgi:two-component system CheB/CheR fusion protein
LEASAEELESTNEELTTLNEEMVNRNAELNRINNDLMNLQASVHLAIVLFGLDLKIRRFSAQAEKQFNLLANDVGRPLSNVRHNLDLSDLEAFIADVIDSAREREREVQDNIGHWYSLRVYPYLTPDNEVDGAVLVLMDIDALKRTERLITESREHAEAIIRTVHDPLVILHGDLRVHSANDAFYRTFMLLPPETEGRSLFELDGGSLNIPRLRQLLEEIIPLNSVFNDFELTHEFERIGPRTMLFNARMLLGHDDKPKLVLLGIRDVTELLHLEAAARLAAIVEFSDDAIISKDLNGIVGLQGIEWVILRDHSGGSMQVSTLRRR